MISAIGHILRLIFAVILVTILGFFYAIKILTE